MVRRILAWMALVLFPVVTAGCGGSNRAEVTGEVTLDGAPVDGGTISFIPTGDTTGPPAWGKIEAGRYSIPACEGPAVGANRVEIRWTRNTGRKIPSIPPAPPDTMIEEIVEAVPARYNSQSELEANVQPGENAFDFTLQSR